VITVREAAKWLVENKSVDEIKWWLVDYKVSSWWEAWWLTLVKWTVVSMFEDEGNDYAAGVIGNRWDTCGLCKYTGRVCAVCPFGEEGYVCFEEYDKWCMSECKAIEVLAKLWVRYYEFLIDRLMEDFLPVGPKVSVDGDIAYFAMGKKGGKVVVVVEREGGRVDMFSVMDR